MEETRNMTNEALDVSLNIILKATHVSWSNADRINDVKSALKSNDNMYKRRIIHLYR
jgi:hypothetical protein